MRLKMLASRTVLAAAVLGTTLVAGAAGLAGVAQAGAAVQARPVVGPSVRVTSCTGQNAEVETATDPRSGILYEEWIGCGGIGFARSTNHGRTFSKGVELPGSAAGWDPAITLGPSGNVYAAFMVTRGNQNYPVVDISKDHGRSFPAVRPLVPARHNNWGDRDFVAVGPTGTIYVTWDYGPVNNIQYVCSPTGSCSFSAGDVNAVVQRSTDGGKTWSKIIPISPGFPASGADSAPILIDPRGRLYVEYQGYQVLNKKTDKLGVAHSYFSISTDNGSRWSRPVRIGPARPTMNTGEWWIDGDIGRDSAGNLYASWDTQSGGRDIGWLSYSTNHGRTWSRLVRVTPDTDTAVHIVQVLGGGRGVVYVGWLTDSARCGRAACYTQYLRVFSIRRGWITPVIRVAANYGNWRVWPGDTIGMSLYPGGRPGDRSVAISWGSALGSAKANSEIWAADVTHLP